MSPSEAVSGADNLLQFLTGVKEPFGGKVALFAGGFRQVLPVMPHAGRAEVVAHAPSRHPYWIDGLVQLFPLTGNARARDDAAYAQ